VKCSNWLIMALDALGRIRFILMCRVDFIEPLKLFLEYLTLKKLIYGRSDVF